MRIKKVKRNKITTYSQPPVASHPSLREERVRLAGGKTKLGGEYCTTDTEVLWRVDRTPESENTSGDLSTGLLDMSVISCYEILVLSIYYMLKAYALSFKSRMNCSQAPLWHKEKL